MIRLTGFFPRWFYISNIVYATYGILGGVTGEYLLFLRNTFSFFIIYLFFTLLSKQKNI
jgi:hypothetical protein